MEGPLHIAISIKLCDLKVGVIIVNGVYLLGIKLCILMVEVIIVIGVYLLGIKLCVLKVGVIIVNGVYLFISIKLRINIFRSWGFIQASESLAMWVFFHAQTLKLSLASMTI